MTSPFLALVGKFPSLAHRLHAAVNQAPCHRERRFVRRKQRERYSFKRAAVGRVPATGANERAYRVVKLLVLVCFHHYYPLRFLTFDHFAVMPLFIHRIEQHLPFLTWFVHIAVFRESLQVRRVLFWKLEIKVRVGAIEVVVLVVEEVGVRS